MHRRDRPPLQWYHRRLRQLKDRQPEKINLRGRQAAWGGKENLDRVKDFLKEYREDSNTIRNWLGVKDLLPCMEELVIPFLNGLRREWDKDPTRLSFDDLLYRAGRGLETPPP